MTVSGLIEFPGHGSRIKASLRGTVCPRRQPELLVNRVPRDAQAAGGFGDVSAGLFPGCYDLVDYRGIMEL
jgi:hypothetical protein